MCIGPNQTAINTEVVQNLSITLLAQKPQAVRVWFCSWAELSHFQGGAASCSCFTVNVLFVVRTQGQMCGENGSLSLPTHLFLQGISYYGVVTTKITWTLRRLIALVSIAESEWPGQLHLNLSKVLSYSAQFSSVHCSGEWWMMSNHPFMTYQHIFP